MKLTENAQAVLLLTTYFTKPVTAAAKPLTPAEWGRFALWLKEFDHVPADLLNSDFKAILKNWHDVNISKKRITELLGRGHAMALALEKWSRAGIWVLTRSDVAYPNRLKTRLKTNAPPVLFGCGNADLLNRGGVAVVGSRNAEPADLKFTEELGKKTAIENCSIVSGGARGIDETVMLAAIKAGGSVVGVLADSLLKAVTSSKWRRGLTDNNLVMISPFYPEAGFNTGNAMGRNKYIYCLADTAVVVHSGRKGGTWNGALENLRKNWVPLWVKPTGDKAAGNAEIVQQGAHWCEVIVDKIVIDSLFEPPVFSGQSMDLFAAPENNMAIAECKTPGEKTKCEVTEAPVQTTPTNFYQIFLTELQQMTSKSSLTTEQICTRLNLHKSQVREWIKQAEEEKQINKLSKPVRYQWAEK